MVRLCGKGTVPFDTRKWGSKKQVSTGAIERAPSKSNADTRSACRRRHPAHAPYLASASESAAKTIVVNIANGAARRARRATEGIGVSMACSIESEDDDEMRTMAMRRL